jgi:hypothetical protein
MTAGKENLGGISLWTSRAGVVLVILLAIAMLLLRERNVLQPHDIPTAAVLILALLGVVEAFSFVCGVVARHTQAGKSGIMLAGTALLLLIAHCLFSFQIPWWVYFLLLPFAIFASRRAKS